MHRIWIIAVMFAIAAWGAPGIRAQSADTTATVSPVNSAVGPTIASATIAPRLIVQPADSPDEALAARRPFGTSQTLMIVGGAAFIAGAIIGDDAGTVMMVAGAGVGLYGLYLYLRTPNGIEGTPGEGAPRSVGLGYRVTVNP
jgi:hypothetical protein